MDTEVFDPTSLLSEKARRRRERKAQKRSEATAKTVLEPRNENQRLLIEAIDFHPVVFAIGPEGTGKTYIPSRLAIQKLINPVSEIEKVIITRPTVAPARHRNGFLPGGMGAKQKPWLVPILDGFKDEISNNQIEKFMQDGTIEIVPFEFMRGRTFHKSFVLLDEGQNCTFSDLKLLVTRTGDGSNVVIAGDVMQLDMDASESGLQRHIDMVDRHDLDADVIEFDAADVVRSKVVSEWVSAYRKDAGLS